MSARVAVELDLGPTFARGDYTSFALVPGVVFSPLLEVNLSSNVGGRPDLGIALTVGTLFSF